jgi:hypothetical protein
MHNFRLHVRRIKKERESAIKETEPGGQNNAATSDAKVKREMKRAKKEKMKKDTGSEAGREKKKGDETCMQGTSARANEFSLVWQSG